MSYIVHKIIGGRKYAYEITSYWDSETKSTKKKQQYIGVVEDKSKPNKKLLTQKLQLDFGDTYLVYKFMERLDIYEILTKSLGKISRDLIPLMCYRLTMQSAMYNAELWLDGNIAKILFDGIDLSSQNISKVLKKIGTEEVQRKFFEKYLSTVNSTTKKIMIDATSLPNDCDNRFNSWGHNDNGMSKQMRMICVVDQETQQPLFYRSLPGNLLDLSSLQNTLLELSKLNIKCDFVLLDAGYFSEENTNELYKQKIDFLTRMPKSRVLYKQLIQTEIADLENIKYATTSGKRGIFAKCVKVDLHNHKAYAYIVLDPIRKGKEAQDLVIEHIQDQAKDAESKQQELAGCGIVIFISSIEIDSKDIVNYYYTRMQIEQVFSFYKTDLQLLPLRKHSEETLSGYLFLQFLVLVVFIQFRNAINEKYTVEQALIVTRNLKCKIFGNLISIAEYTKKQKEVYELCKINIPKNWKF